ncbi:MAG TPA: hypothetical protein VFR09_04800 [Alphaproteobacteria bacterium]|nr:hypothetical protein [Alphaproteobacteria bacterium]
MSVSGIGSYGSFISQYPTQQSSAAQATGVGSGITDTSDSAQTPEQAFMNYMKESPAQRMIDEWLKAHGLTEESLQKLPAAQREAVEKQMAQDIKQQLEQKATADKTVKGGILV